jgi:membrane protein implicated in regulation of membrane protease activity
MPAWAVWIAIGIVFGASELLTSGLIAAAAAVGSLGAAVSAGAGAPEWVEIVVLAAGSLAASPLRRRRSAR